MVIWIARDKNLENDWGEVEPGNLTAFYDSPILEHHSRGDMWGCARVIGNIPNYMFPEIKPGECKKFIEEK